MALISKDSPENGETSSSTSPPPPSSNGTNGVHHDDSKPSIQSYARGPAARPKPPGTENVTIREQPYGTRRHMRVIVIGAGISGMTFFKLAEEQLQDVDIVCYEKNADIGGTWFENRYAGCACDIPSVNYQFSWRPHIWSKYYSPSKEIWEYLKEVERENNFIEKFIKLRHRVTAVEWSDKTAVWKVTVKNLEDGSVLEDTADLLLNATGILNNWKWPAIKGLHDFKGKLMHSAVWDEDYDLTGKKVAVIGAGSSAVQIIPNIYSRVERLYTWIRSPVWITAGFAQKFAGKDGANFYYTEEQKQYLKENPEEYLAYRKMIENELNQRFGFIIQGSKMAKAAREYSENEMTAKLAGNERIRKKIIPTDFGVGCRRPTPGNGYLEALVGEKTTCFTEEVKEITSRGFVDHEGVQHEVDVIACATGFDTSWVPPFEFIINGEDRRETWRRTGVPPYLSIGVGDVPNYFTFCGPFGPVAHGSFFPIVQKYTDCVLKVIQKMQVEYIRSLRPRMAVSQHFERHAAKFLERTAWSMPCSSWFKNGTVDGTPTVYPGSRLHFMWLLESPRFEDFDIEYEDENDMFSFLGNGFHALESDGSDISWYLGTLKAPVSESHLVEKMAGIDIERPL